MNVLAFDIETVPDVNAGRRLYNFSGISDADVAAALYAKQREKNTTEFLPAYLHRVIAISAVLRSRDHLKVWSLGDTNSTEKEIIQRFFDGIEKFIPVLISWNGSGFDLPVLHHRGLINGVIAAKYFEIGDLDNQFRHNNYISRYHYRHMDLMDILAGYQPRANAPLDQMATLMGFPGKMGMHGSQVWETYQKGNIEIIRCYCETDALNTYLLYLRFEMMRGKLTPEQYQTECMCLRNYLEKENKAHFQEFLARWEQRNLNC